MKKALITGITGQDAPYLAELLLTKGYEVYGCYRRKSKQEFINLERLGIKDKVNLVEMNIDDMSNIIRVLQEIQPDEFYNLAALSFVGASWDNPIAYTKSNALAVVHMLEAIRLTDKSIKFYQASTSEMYGNTPPSHNETTPFNPCSPYATAKLFAHHIVRNYRESFNMFACSGILFNHESMLRGSEFVTQKIVKTVIDIVQEKSDCLEIGNMNSKRDWGFAGDFVRGMWLMLQNGKPDDFVLATNESHSVREFITICFNKFGIDIKFKGEGLDEIGTDNNGKIVVRVNSKFYRPNELNVLRGDFSKAKVVLGWQPETSFKELVNNMINGELEFRKSFH